MGRQAKARSRRAKEKKAKAVHKEKMAKAKVEKAQKSKVAAERRMKRAKSERSKKALQRKIKEKSSKVRAAKAKAQEAKSKKAKAAERAHKAKEHAHKVKAKERKFKVGRKKPRWRYCTGENGFCRFHGRKRVKYGAKGKFKIMTKTGGVKCSNRVFGDPLRGTVKKCYVEHVPHRGPRHGCSPVKQGAVHCGEKFGTRCINSNTPIKSLKEAWKKCGQVKGCTRIMHWAKDGKYYLRSAKDKVIRGAHSRNNFRAYLPHKYKCLSHTSGAVRKERTAKAKVEKAQKSKVAAERRMKTATSERHKKSLERKVKEKSSKVRAAKARAQRKSNCMRKWRCGISGLNAPMSIAADGNVQCMSTNGRDCWWGRCRGRTVPRHGKLRPLKCGAMHKRVWGGTGYSSKGHWCNKVKAPVARICRL